MNSNQKPVPAAVKEESAVLSAMERDTIGEILNISMGAAATAVSTLLGRPVDITTPVVSVVRTDNVVTESLEPAVGIEIEYCEGLSGSNLLIMKSRDIRAIVDQLLAGDDDSGDDELNEMHYSAISEIMNQMMGASATALSTFLGSSINISTPSQFDVKAIKDKINGPEEQEYVVSVRFLLHIEDLVDSEFITVMPVAFTKELVEKAMIMDGNDEPQAQETPPAAKASPAPQPAMSAPQARTVEEPVMVQPLKLQSFDEQTNPPESGGSENFNFILDVPLELSVEIGRTKMQVKDILDLRQGSIVELDKQAGDPVDIFVNGRIIARGDVVVINDNFGVRITKII